MDPITIGLAATGLASSVYSGWKAGQERKKMNKKIGEMERDNQAFYNANALGDFEITGHIQPSAAAIAAAGATQGTATLIVDTNTIVTSSTAGSADGVILPGLATTIIGTQISVSNKTANTIKLYPPTSGTLDGGSANTPISLPASESVTVIATTAAGAAWAVINRAIVAGTNVTITYGIGTATINSTGGGASLIVKEEGTNITTAATSLNFVGTGVTATNVGNDVTVTVSGGGGGAPTDADYVILTPNPSLPNSRTLASAEGILISDYGPAGDITISVSRGGVGWGFAGPLPTATQRWSSLTYGNGRFVASCGGSPNTNGAISYHGIGWTVS